MTTPAPSDAEIARRSHSFLSAIRNGVEVWYAVLGGIAAWAIHLLFFAAFVRFTCTTDGHLWAMHALTVVCVLMTAAALFLSARLTRRPAEGTPSEGPATLRFLGRLGLILNSFNLALILLEEVVVVTLGARRCG